MTAKTGKEDGTMRKSLSTMTLALLLAWPLCGDVHAIDLAGTWEGTVSCTRNSDLHDEGGTRRDRRKFTVLMDNRHLAFFDGSTPSAAYRTHIVRDRRKPGKAVVGLESCADYAGSEDTGRLQVTTNPRSGKGRLRGSSTYSSGIFLNFVGDCRWSFKRISTDAPRIPGCEVVTKFHVAGDTSEDHVSLNVAYPAEIGSFFPSECRAVGSSEEQRLDLVAEDAGTGNLLLHAYVAHGTAKLKLPIEVRCPFRPLGYEPLRESALDAVVVGGGSVWPRQERMHVVVDAPITP